jgi:hypothetical protein
VYAIPRRQRQSLPAAHQPHAAALAGGGFRQIFIDLAFAEAWAAIGVIASEIGCDGFLLTWEISGRLLRER